MFLLLFLCYHTRLTLISEAPVQHVEGARVIRSWCMCVVSHGYDALSGGRDEGGGWYACRTKPGGEVGRMSGDAGTLPECKVIHR